MNPPPPQDPDAAAVWGALRSGDPSTAMTALAAVAPAWYRQARHAELCEACEALQALMPGQPLPESVALWRALATWYVAPAQALALFQALAERRGLRPGRAPAAMPQLGEDLYLLAALFRSELATMADAGRLAALAAALEEHLNAPQRAQAPVIGQLGGITAVLSWWALTGAAAAEQARLSAESLGLVARLDDRHSLCSVVALARWPLLRGDMALARETCELITVGLLAGDDDQMPLAHGWLMAVQAALARPGSVDLLGAWQDGSMDREAVLASPIAPALLGALVLLDAQAPRGDAELAALVLSRQERWSPLERWQARAARAWAHLRDHDLPAARALLRLLDGDALPPDSLLALIRQLLHAQARWLAGEPGPALPSPATLVQRGWPGPAMLCRLLAWADPARPVPASEVGEAEQAWRQHGLALPLFTAPGLAQQVIARLQADGKATLAPGWTAAVQRALQTAPPGGGDGAAMTIRLLDGLALEVHGKPLAWGRKPPRRLLELVALLALQAPHETPPYRLADALYPELDGDAARRALDTALYRLRRLLPTGALRRGTIGVGLDPAVVHVDRQGPCERWLPEFEQPWADSARAGDALMLTVAGTGGRKGAER